MLEMGDERAFVGNNSPHGGEPEPNGEEFSMGSDDGSSSSSDSVPSKYLYSSLPRTAQSGFVVKLDAWVYHILSL